MVNSKFYRQIGNTGIKTSVLGLGTVKIGRNTQVKYPNTFSIPNDKEVKNLFAKAFDLGINLIDTAPAYGNSEERIGNLLKNNRKNWILSSKAGEIFSNNISTYNFSKKFIFESVKNSLKNLKTDYLDVLLIHSNGDDIKIINEESIFNTLDDLKQQGLIRASGMSTKTIEGGLQTIHNSDIAMITYNPLYTEELPVIEQAYKLNKGIFIKKALFSGHINKLKDSTPLKTTLNFILKQKSVSSIIIGTINPSHLEANVNAIL